MSLGGVRSAHEAVAVVGSVVEVDDRPCVVMATSFAGIEGSASGAVQAIEGDFDGECGSGAAGGCAAAWVAGG
ncbi:hypothetical protein ACFHW0_28210, partial [Micromonospora sp. LOL_025]|uniref:hypothetical protein n=1 Tax=Micromonospora sp. LOL_025 TaxID=3345413 RepID=UPI003A83E9EE